MSGYGYSEEHQPVTHWRGYPIYASHFIVIVYCTLMIVAAVLGEHTGGILSWVGFSSAQVWSGQIWRLASYGLFNLPSLPFAIDMLMIVWFGRELERTFGRKLFSFLYGGIYLAPTLVLTLIAEPASAGLSTRRLTTR